VFKRHLKLIRWSVGIAFGVLAGLWIAVLMLSNTDMLRQKLVDTLSEKLDADVELATFSVTTFPLLRIHGDRLKLRLKGQKNPAPFIEVNHFEVASGLFGLLHRQKRFKSVELQGLRITIPPKTGHDKEAGARAGSAASDGPVLIDVLTSKDAELVIVPKNPLKQPKVWAIHDLALESVGFNRKMPYTATLTNPLPKGEIVTKGSFGPWIKGDPGLTPLDGHYTFEDANLDTIKGIGGILDSIGDFTGQLEEIDVKGKTTTPDFSIDVGGTPVPLTTTFHAVVDGTNGNTYLKQVDAKLAETAISAAGEIESQPGVKGRTVRLDVKIIDGRIEDVLKLAVKGKGPVMLGRIALQAVLLLPPGHDIKVIDRLQLDGRFALENAQFTDKGVQDKLGEMSRRAQGKKPDEPMRKPVSDMRGRFVLKDSAIRFQPLVFMLPGAEIDLNGVYGMKSQALDFKGTLSMDATVSQAAGGGIRGFFLKVADPIFRKSGKGAIIPIVITGPREQPKFGVEWGKVFK
jgi:hypothetical protein